MNTLKQTAKEFRDLHVRGRPLVLFNVWDAGSAKAVTAAGAKAIATGSWSVAAANGYGDGEQVPLDVAIDNLSRIVRATSLPVTIDIESGYGKTAEEVGRTVERTIQAGAVGCNLEDSFVENGKLRPIEAQQARLRSARAAAARSGISYFLNARTDVFFQKPAEEHDDEMLKAAIDRAVAYAEAGADGLFAPGLVDREMIAQLAKACPLPLNIMASDKTPGLNELAEAGVARVSHGPGPYIQTMKALEALARGAWSEQ